MWGIIVSSCVSSCVADLRSRAWNAEAIHALRPLVTHPSIRHATHQLCGWRYNASDPQIVSQLAKVNQDIDVACRQLKTQVQSHLKSFTIWMVLATTRKINKKCSTDPWYPCDKAMPSETSDAVACSTCMGSSCKVLGEPACLDACNEHIHLFLATCSINLMLAHGRVGVYVLW
jgi:hypothetical protein